MSSIQVIGLGALNMDNLYFVDRILDNGEAVVNKTTSTPGGSAANTICGLARLGISTGFIGVVGDDAEGKRLLHDFGANGVDTSHVRVESEAKTGSVLCLSDRQGKRSLYVIPGANNRLSRNDLDLTYISQAKMLHISSFVHDQQFQILLALTDMLSPTTSISFSPGALYATKGLTTLAPILNRTHVLFTNRDELRQLTGEEVVAGAEHCLSQGCHIVAITLGQGIRLEWDKGTKRQAVTTTSYIRDRKNEYIITPAPQKVLRVIDTTGAGDAFAAGFLYGLLNNKGLETCGRLGDIVAQFSVTEAGARQGLPTLTQLSQCYHELYGQGL